MASESKQLFEALKPLNAPKVEEPDSDLSAEIRQIFRQAAQHRGSLIRFYIAYTSLLSIAVVALIYLQAQARLIDGNEQLELIPQGALDLIVVGMFGQFIGLLTIVTKKVWEYKPFLEHVRNNNSNNHDDSAGLIP